MKVAVYAIAKNEQQLVARWAQSCIEADCCYTLYTDSADCTPQETISNKVTFLRKQFDSWLFDATCNRVLMPYVDVRI